MRLRSLGGPCSRCKPWGPQEYGVKSGVHRDLIIATANGDSKHGLVCDLATGPGRLLVNASGCSSLTPSTTSTTTTTGSALHTDDGCTGRHRVP